MHILHLLPASFGSGLPVTNEGKASQEQHRRHIRGGKDTIEPDAFGGAFDKSLSVAEEHGALDSYNEGPHDSGRHDSETGDTVVLPVMGEPIGNECDCEKQDYERNAAKRWLSKCLVEADASRGRPFLVPAQQFKVSEIL